MGGGVKTRVISPLGVQVYVNVLRAKRALEGLTPEEEKVFLALTKDNEPETRQALDKKGT